MLMQLAGCPTQLGLYLLRRRAVQRHYVTVVMTKVSVVDQIVQPAVSPHPGNTPSRPMDLRSDHVVCTVGSWDESCVSHLPWYLLDSSFPWDYLRYSAETLCVQCWSHTRPIHHRMEPLEMQIAMQLLQRTSLYIWWSSGSLQLRFQYW